MSKVLFVIFVSAIICLAISAGMAVKHRDIELKLNSIDLFVLLLVGYMAVRLVFTDYAHLSNPYFIFLIALTGVYFIFKELISRGLRKKSSLLKYVLIGSLLIIGLLQACYGLLQLYGVLPSGNQYFAVTGSFGNPDPYAGYLATVMPFAAGVYFLDHKKRIPQFLKYLSLAMFIACLLVLPAAYIRGAWLAVVAGMGFIFFFKYNLVQRFRNVINTTNKKIACATISLLIFGLVGTGLYVLKPNSAYGRLFIWKVTSGMVADHPVFGAGLNRFKAEYNNYQAAYFASGSGNAAEKQVAGNVHQAHNEYLQILAELGIAGFLLFGGVLVGLFLRAYQSLIGQKIKNDSKGKEWFIKSILASLLSVSVLALFSCPFHILPTAVMAVFLLACFSAVIGGKWQIKVPCQKAYVSVAFTMLFMVVGFAGFYYSHKTYNQYKDWNTVVASSFISSTSTTDNYTDSLFQQLYPVFKNEGKFLFNYGSYFVRSGRLRQAIPILEKAKATFAGPHLYALLGKCYQETEEFKNAAKNLKHASLIRPSKLHPRYLLAKLYMNEGATAKAVQKAQQILTMQEKVKTAAGREIRVEMKKLIETADSSTL